MKGKNKDLVTGKFVCKELPSRKVTAMINPDQYDALKARCIKGEYVADKVREAIAFYLAHHPIDTETSQRTRVAEN
jgi:hypothetical protein